MTALLATVSASLLIVALYEHPDFRAGLLLTSLACALSAWVIQP